MTEIIAEIGINHMGNLDVAHKLIMDAAECGATVAKFQWYSVKDLFGDPSKSTYRPDIYKTVAPFELTEDMVVKLMTWCNQEGIEFMCSVFDNERFDKLEQMGVLKHKAASRVSKYDRELAKKMLDTGKPTYVSLGFDAEPFDKNIYSNYLPLYCVAKYPSEYNDFELPKDFAQSKFYGFSSHAMTPYPSMVALARGAKCVEVHFTLDKAMSVLPGGFDHMCSLNKKELKQLCDFAKHSEKIF